jgi:hypothetical protein
MVRETSKDKKRRQQTERKRSAAKELRKLAAEVGLATIGRNADINKQQFQALLSEVKQCLLTAAQELQVEALGKLYVGPSPSSSSAAPELPVEVASSSAAPTAQTQDKAQPFRIRGQSVLLTYNSDVFLESNKDSIWSDFLGFLGGLLFVSVWTATMERSLKSEDVGRVHLRVFLEFWKAVDWLTLVKVHFQGHKPNAEPTVARGSNQKDVINQGHFYAWAAKVGTLCVQTSGYEPWIHYTVKGWWIDQLWSAHKLGHEVYLSYVALDLARCSLLQKMVLSSARRRRSVLKTSLPNPLKRQIRIRATKCIFSQ